jgi:hypothetical protein
VKGASFGEKGDLKPERQTKGIEIVIISLASRVNIIITCSIYLFYAHPVV